jgi:hypothetical protein
MVKKLLVFLLTPALLFLIPSSKQEESAPSVLKQQLTAMESNLGQSIELTSIKYVELMSQASSYNDIYEVSGFPWDIPISSVEEAFMLASRPDAPITFYLDFDGGELSGTHWNLNSGEELISLDGIDFDGEPGYSFTDANLFHSIWAKVSATFYQYNVNVTTIKPTAEQMLRFNDTDETYGVHVMFTTPESGDRIGCRDNCAGIAMIDEFGQVLPEDGSRTAISPVFISPAQGLEDLRHAAWKYAHIAIHEIGHYVGLEHDGEGNDKEYAPPLGALSFYMGETPSKYGRLARWSDGSYYSNPLFSRRDGSKVNREDDLAILAEKLTLLEDDYANVYDSSARKTDLRDLPSAIGILSHHNDVDVLPVSLNEGAIVKIRVSPSNHNHQLAAKVQYFGEGGYISEYQEKPKGYWSSTDASDTLYLYAPDGLSGYLKISAVAGAYYGLAVSNSTKYGSLGPWVLSTEIIKLPANFTLDESDSLVDSITLIRSIELSSRGLY